MQQMATHPRSMSVLTGLSAPKWGEEHKNNKGRSVEVEVTLTAKWLGNGAYSLETELIFRTHV